MGSFLFAIGEPFWQLGRIKNFIKKTVRMSGSLKKEVDKRWKKVSGKRSAFYRAAIDAAADIDKDRFFEAFRHFQDGKAEVSDAFCLTGRHIKLLEDRVEQIAERLNKPKRSRKNKRPKLLGQNPEDTDPVAVAIDEPGLSAVIRVILSLFIDSLPLTADEQGEQEQLRIAAVTEGLFSNPILIENEAVPGEVLRRRPWRAGVLLDWPEGDDYLRFIDASALFAATVRILPGESSTGQSPLDPASPLAMGILSKAVTGKIELVAFRTEVIRYCQMLFEALNRNCAEPKMVRQEVVTKGRLILNSGLKIADIEPTAVIRAADLPQSLPPHIKLMVAQMELMAVRRKVLVVSCGQDLVGVSDKVRVWHPNDLPQIPKAHIGDAEQCEGTGSGFMINKRPPKNTSPLVNMPQSVKKRRSVKRRSVEKRPLKGKKRISHKRGVEPDTPSLADASVPVSEIDIPF